MPPPLDLTGRRFGKLLVLSKAETGNRGGKWLCRCDCGREEVIPAIHLPHADYIAKNRYFALSCSECRFTRTCAECGKTFHSHQLKATCSEDCKKIRKNAADMRAYFKALAENPEKNRKRHRQIKAAAEADPEKKARLQEAQRRAGEKKKARLQADPVRRETVRAQARSRYSVNAEKVQARRKARREALSPEQKTDLVIRIRKQSREWWREKRNKLRKNPERYAEYLTKMRGYQQDHASRKALAEFATTAAKLEKMSKK